MLARHAFLVVHAHHHIRELWRGRDSGVESVKMVVLGSGHKRGFRYPCPQGCQREFRRDFRRDAHWTNRWGWWQRSQLERSEKTSAGTSIDVYGGGDSKLGIPKEMEWMGHP